MPPTFFIDLDGTVMTNPFWPAVFPALSRHLAGKTGLTAQAITGLFVAENKRRTDAGTWQAAVDWDSIAQSVAQALGVTCELSAEQLVIEHASPPHTAMLDHADQVLPAIIERGWRVVIATHGLTRYQRPVLQALGLWGFFSDIAAPDTRHCFKWQRAFWLPYLDNGETAVHCGDLYKDDVAPARAFGMYSVWKVPSTPTLSAIADPCQRAAAVDLPSGMDVRPHAAIIDLIELPGVLDRLRRR